MSEHPPQESPRRQPKTARDQRAALIAGIAAAVIAAVAGITGSVVGAKVASSEAQSQADRDFQRTQRLAVYMEVVDAFDTHNAAMTDTFTALLTWIQDRDSKAAHRAYVQSLDDLGPTSERLSHSITKVHLVSSERAQETAMRLWEESKFTQAARSYPQTVEELQDLSGSWFRLSREYRSAFVQVAKADIQGYPIELAQ